MSTGVVLVQHAEKHEEAGDSGLTEAGHRQAERLVPALVRLAPAAVVSSPLRRAVETAMPVARALGMPILIDARLRERVNLGPGVDRARFLRDWGRMNEDRTWTPTGMPDARTSLATGRDMLAAVAAHAVPDRTVVLVTHGGATVDLLRTLLGDGALAARAPRLVQEGPPATALTRLIAADGSPWEASVIADAEHLDASD